MRSLRKNKQKMYYALQIGQVPIYTEFTEQDGSVSKIETGEYKTAYAAPVEFYGNISMSGGESEAVEFGLNLGDYQAVLLVAKGMLPLIETSRIWHTSEPRINDDGTVDEYSADYTIVKISPSLNFDKYVLKKVVK